MSKHTPGPWEIDGDLILGPPGSGRDYTRNGTGHSIVCAQESADCERWDVDSPLIAAAPDLLEALRETLDVVFNETVGVKSAWIDGVKDRSRAALAKAEGR